MRHEMTVREIESMIARYRHQAQSMRVKAAAIWWPLRRQSTRSAAAADDRIADALREVLTGHGSFDASNGTRETKALP